MFTARRIVKTSRGDTLRNVSQRAFSMNVFNTDVKKVQRNNAALRPDHGDYDYLKHEVARRVIDRLSFINMEFPKVLELGSGSGTFTRLVAERFVNNINNPYKYIKPQISMESVSRLDPTQNNFAHLPEAEQAATQEELQRALEVMDRYSIPGLKSYTVVDPSPAALANTKVAVDTALASLAPEQRFELHSICGDLPTVPYEPAQLPVGEAAGYDLVVSNLSMHWENDLPGVFNRAMQYLKPNGAFIGAMIGGESLRELRSSFTVAGLERRGGVTHHVSPFARPRDVGDLMSAAGFEMLSVDLDSINIHYPDMFTLCDHLQRMGEQNAPANFSNVPRDVFLAASAAYDALYRDPSNDLLLCTVDVVMFIGWKHHESMHKPAKRGSATHKLGDELPRPQ